MKFSAFLIAALFFSACRPGYDVIQKEYRFRRHGAPPGCVKLNDTLFIDRTEVRNLDYLEYVHWLKKHAPEQVSAALPDTTVWNSSQGNNRPLQSHYFSHPAYRDHPVVGISYEQAMGFCRWRTARVKEFDRILDDRILEENNAKDYYYRLPTKAEWEYAASAGLQGSAYGYERLNENNVPKINVKESHAFSEQPLHSEPVYARYPNRYGIWNMTGNVAEMLAVEGISKGGSWKNPLEECAISDSIRAKGPAEWLGFRCVCIIVKNSTNSE